MFEKHYSTFYLIQTFSFYFPKQVSNEFFRFTEDGIEKNPCPPNHNV